TNIRAQNLLGIVIITSAGKFLIWGACDISVDHSYTVEVMSQIENIYNELESNSIKIACFVIDSVAAYTVA
ncbi:20196_t:CDS:1, partial [Dentiscutata erythropus]